MYQVVVASRSERPSHQSTSVALPDLPTYVGLVTVKASCTPSSVIPVGHSSEATRTNPVKTECVQRRRRTRPTCHSDGVRPRVLMSCCSGSGVKRECRACVMNLKVAGMDVLLIERYGEYIRVTQRDRLARGRCQVKNHYRTRRATSLNCDARPRTYLPTYLIFRSLNHEKSSASAKTTYSTYSTYLSDLYL